MKTCSGAAREERWEVKNWPRQLQSSLNRVSLVKRLCDLRSELKDRCSVMSSIISSPRTGPEKRNRQGRHRIVEGESDNFPKGLDQGVAHTMAI